MITAYRVQRHARHEDRMRSQLTFLKTIPLFADLGELELRNLAAAFAYSHFAQGNVIFYQGELGQSLFVVESGCVRIAALGEDGHEQLVSLCRPGDIFGELALIDEQPRSAGAVAIEPTTLLTLSRERFHEQMRRTPQLALNFLRLLCDRLRSTTLQVGSMAFLSVPERLARTLLELSRDYGIPDAQGVRLNVPLTQSDLASLIGATRESTNKTLRTFQRRGLLAMRQNQIVIIDPAGLAALGGPRSGGTASA